MLLASLLAMLLVNLGLSLEAGVTMVLAIHVLTWGYHGIFSMTHDTM